jgi:hypothetical protein
MEQHHNFEVGDVCSYLLNWYLPHHFKVFFFLFTITDLYTSCDINKNNRGILFVFFQYS